jgi:hypothetical protein
LLQLENLDELIQGALLHQLTQHSATRAEPLQQILQGFRFMAAAQTSKPSVEQEKISSITLSLDTLLQLKDQSHLK